VLRGFAIPNVVFVKMGLETLASCKSCPRTYFPSFLNKISVFPPLLAHIDVTPTPDPATDAWRQASCIRSWLYGSVDSSVLDFTMEPDQTTRQLWAAIEDHFTANQAPCAIFLSHSFHTMTQGDLSVEDYGKKMKKVVNALRDVGMPVDAPTLLLNLLRYVNSRFNTATDIIVGTVGMTSSTALDQLKLKELRLENEANVEATNALVALSTSSSSTSSGSTGSACRPSHARRLQLLVALSSRSSQSNRLSFT
jgi:hypothetical protein